MLQKVLIVLLAIMLVMFMGCENLVGAGGDSGNGEEDGSETGDDTTDGTDGTDGTSDDTTGDTGGDTTGDDTGDTTDDTTGDTTDDGSVAATFSPPVWILGEWRYEDSTGYATYTFSEDNVVYESNFGESNLITDYAQEYPDATQEDTNSVYSLTETGAMMTTRWEWTLEENGTLLFQVFYDGEESTSLTKHFVPTDLVGLPGTVDLDDSYEGASLYVVAEDAAENELDSQQFAVGPGSNELYDFQLFVDASATEYNMYIIVDPDAEFGTGDEITIPHIDSPLQPIDGGSIASEIDFPLVRISGTIETSGDPADGWTAEVFAWDSEQAMNNNDDPIGYQSIEATSGTHVYEWDILVDLNYFENDEAWLAGILDDEAENTQEIGIYGGNPLSLTAGQYQQGITINTATAE